MFQSLTEKLNGIFKNLKGRGKLNEKDIDHVLKEIRMALLEADVNFKVAKDFIASIRERAVGHEVLDSLTPAQQVIKIVRDQMVELLGGESAELDLTVRPPAVILLVGLQGSGKTTTSAKLARNLKESKKKVLLVPADTYRPAAIDQLKKLGSNLGVEVFNSEPSLSPVEICRNAVEDGRINTFDVVIIDSAGRLQIDEPLMEELKQIKQDTGPVETLLVADAMTGQEAVNVAKKFDSTLELTGMILTKLDGDARGGAALSIKAVTGKPLKFVGTGEGVNALEAFHPDRMASRILDMGDVISLIEKAEQAFEGEDVEGLQKKFKEKGFDLEDFRNQMKSIKKIGSLDQIMDLIPGMGGMKQKGLSVDDKELTRIDAIISSMTMKERKNPSIINGSRRLRISKGSGTAVQDVNRLLKNFQQTQKMMKKLSRGGLKGLKRGGMMPFLQ